MFLRIDFNNGEAIYIQLRSQIIAGIAMDMIREGDTLPSVRRMAGYIGINVHTVNKAYSVLRQEDFIRLDRRKDAVVSLDVDKMQAIDGMQGDPDMVLTWGIYKNISRDEIHHLAGEIYDKYTRGCIGAEDGQETGEGQKLLERGRRLSVRISRHVLKRGQDYVVQKTWVRPWIIVEDSYVM